MAQFKVTIPRLLARLEEVGKAGATLAELAQALGVAVAHVSGAVCSAEKDGLTGWHYHPSATSSNRKRWWLLEHRPAVAPRSERATEINRVQQVRIGRPAKIKPITSKQFIDERFSWSRPPDYVSQLDANECRPWAKAVA